MSIAYLLVSHGSRDLRPYRAMQNLAVQLRERLRLPTTAGVKPPIAQKVWTPTMEPLVGIATLELSRESLAEQIRAFSDRAAASRYSAVRVMPLFLLPGVHVMEDIPREVAQAQAVSHLPIQICPYLGSHPAIAHTLAEGTFTMNVTRLLLAHGSSYPDANQPIEAIAHQLNSETAYWAIAPSLESKITEFVEQGCQTIDILPYFLFRGSITDAIAQEVDQLQSQFPSVTLHLSPPLGVKSTTVDLVFDLMTQPQHA